ncbi:MAG TPA: T9SS type A sorting domain-containing protein [Bacteroidia bacterium]|nr:T9SS type A sorting domain-containing protein [Bacteroidia bacterium]
MKKLYTIATALFLSVASIQAQNIIDVVDADLVGGQTYNWTKNNVYVLDGVVFLEDGGTLNIEAGTVVKFTPRADVGNPSALVICRGAKIYATGTVAEPIIFTAEDDDMADAEDLGPTDNALWGGLVLLGKAYTIKNGNTEVNVEGIPTTEPRGIYGMPAGTNIDNDNSGVLRYISIRHGGRQIASGSELNGLTLGAVGNATTVEHIEIYANSDDGIEFFGGTVNVKYAAVAFTEDDSFDWDESWTGKGQFWFSIQRDDIADAGWECDGSTPDDLTPSSDPIVFNGTHIGSGPAAAAANPIGWLFRAGTKGYIANSIVTEMKGKGIEVQDKPSVSTDAYAQLLAGELIIKNNLFYNIGSTTVIDGSANGIIRITASADDASATALITHLTNNSNQIANPGIYSISRIQNGLLDPRPSGTGAAYTTSLDAYPSGDAFFTPVNYKGAFSTASTDLWLSGWSTLAKNGHLVNLTGLNEYNNVLNSLMLYPNPTKGVLNIAFESDKNVLVQIMNAQGQLVRTLNNQNAAGNLQTIDVSELSKGLYIISFTSENKQYSKKLIIE